MPKTVWSLHQELAKDTAPVGDLELSRVLAINAADYPWLVLVPRRQDLSEIADLGGEAPLLMSEIALTARVLKEITQCDKINVAAIGNVVPQLHVHIVARWKNDPLWPKPVWGVAPLRLAEPEAFARFIATIRAKLGLATTATV